MPPAIDRDSAAMPDAEGQDRYAAPRKAMVETIVALTRETAAETGRASLDSRVLTAMNKVPRHRFVPADQEPNAYANRPLPIGNGQTISQPFIVALMTDMLGLKATDRVLEIGTGCGYQAAVLAELAREVYTIEIVAPLAREAAARFAELGYRNINARSGDGYRGLAGPRAVRRDHRDGRRARSATGIDRAIEARRQARDSGRRAMERPGTAHNRERPARQNDDPQRAGRAFRAAHARERISAAARAAVQWRPAHPGR